MFLDHLYGGIDEPELKIIDVFICKLRKKIAAATGAQHYIETVWGRGYVLKSRGAGRAQGGAQRPAHPGAPDAGGGRLSAASGSASPTIA